MAEQAPIFIDGFSRITKGIHSGIAPLLLDRETLSFAINVSMRGNYCTHRPAYIKRNLTFVGNIQEAFELGVFQGATFFTPDYGSPSLIAQIDGRWFKVVPDNLGGAAVSEIPIPGGANPVSATQAWLWQAESWVIGTDGISFPIFYDNITARRSLGNEFVTVATTVAGFNSGSAGDDIEIQIALPYADAVDIPVTIDDQGYTVKSYRSGTLNAGYTITLRQTAGAAGVSYAAGDSGNKLRVFKFYIGFTTTAITGWAPSGVKTVDLTHPYTGLVGDNISILSDVGPLTITVQSITGSSITAQRTASPADTANVLAGSQVSGAYPFLEGLWTTLLQVADYTSPGVGSTVTVDAPALFPGAVGTFVYPPGATEEYEVMAFGPDLTETHFITVTNVSASGAHAFPLDVIYNANEMPVGRMGAYVMGRNWMSLADGRSFIASDLVGTSSGTQTYSYRDAVLRISENNFLAGGGVFIIPGTIGQITAIVGTATLDASLGQGPVQIGTPTTMFSVNAPVDRTLWQDMENPILTQSLIGEGPLGQNSTIPANSDTLFRTNIGLGSLILARREFATWGNTSISKEVQRIIDRDDVALLNFGSAIVFQNRLLETSKPTQSERGVFHQGLISLNFDPVSSLAGKAPSIYEGLWLGVNTLQFLKGRIDGINRAFALAFNRSTKAIELYELLKDDAALADNNGIDVPITWQMETGCLFSNIKGKGEFDLVKLIDGELYVAEVAGNVAFKVDYRSQFDPCWHLWTEFSICATESETDADNIRKQNRVSLGLGKPPVDSCDPSNNRPTYVGETFQFRITITGHCKLYGMTIKASQEPKKFFTKAICGPVCT